MKIAISSEGNTIKSLIDQRFGRCKYFLIVEIKDHEIKGINAVENKGVMQGHGAGIKAAKQVGDLEVGAVITGNLGPNATDVLNQSKIKVYHGSGMVKDAINKFIDKKLNEITEIAESHSSTNKAKSDERIFFPLLDNQGVDSNISDHFGHAPFFGLYNLKTKNLEITKNTLNHTDPNKSPVDQIVDAVNPTTVFALGIGARAIQLFNAKGISIKTGDYRTVKEVVDNPDKLDLQSENCGHEHH